MSEPILKGDRVPVGAQLRIGRKNPQSGYPEMNDRFFIVSRHESATTFGKRKGTYKPMLPEFASFNDRSEREPITVIKGELVHARREDCWHYERRAQQLPGKEWPNHPNRRAACSSPDGDKATRLYAIGQDGTEEWKEIDCPGRVCEFSQEWDNGKGQKYRPCKVAASLYFVPRWAKDSIPSPLMVFVTHSWATAENVEGFFNFIDARAAEAGIPHSYLGVPFILSLSRQTQPQHGRSFPVVSISVDGDLVNAFINVRANLQLAGADVPQLTTALDEDEDEARDVDFEEIDTPAVPGELF